MFNNQKNLIIAIITLGILGFLLIGVGITGNVIMNTNTIGDVCSSDTDCQNGKICCLFYQENSGICHTTDMCETVMDITKSENNQMEVWRDFSKELPKNDKTYSLEILFGILILIAVGISLYILGKTSKQTSKKKETGKKIKKKRR